MSLSHRLNFDTQYPCSFFYCDKLFFAFFFILFAFFCFWFLTNFSFTPLCYLFFTYLSLLHFSFQVTFRSCLFDIFMGYFFTYDIFYDDLVLNIPDLPSFALTIVCSLLPICCLAYDTQYTVLLVTNIIDFL